MKPRALPSQLVHRSNDACKRRQAVHPGKVEPCGLAHINSLSGSPRGRLAWRSPEQGRQHTEGERAELIYGKRLGSATRQPNPKGRSRLLGAARFTARGSPDIYHERTNVHPQLVCTKVVTEGCILLITCQERHRAVTCKRVGPSVVRALSNDASLGTSASPALRRFVILVHNPLPPCACQLQLHSLDQFKLDLVCRCVGAVSARNAYSALIPLYKSLHHVQMCTMLNRALLYVYLQALLVSDGARRDSEIVFVYPRDGEREHFIKGHLDDVGSSEQGHWVLRVRGSEVAHARPGERDIGSVLRYALPQSDSQHTRYTRIH
eukprot:403514-Prorocentrum_minimum.AAC.3